MGLFLGAKRSMSINFRKDLETATLYANYILTSNHPPNPVPTPTYNYEHQVPRLSEPVVNTIDVGDVTLYLSLTVAILAGATWLFGKLTEVEKTLTRQTLLSEQSIALLNKLTTKLEKQEYRIDQQDIKFNSVFQNVGLLSDQMSNVIKAIDDLEEYLNTTSIMSLDEKGSQLVKKYSRRIRFLPHYRYNIEHLSSSGPSYCPVFFNEDEKDEYTEESDSQD